jgi:hypothetical protein
MLGLTTASGGRSAPALPPLIAFVDTQKAPSIFSFPPSVPSVRDRFFLRRTGMNGRTANELPLKTGLQPKFAHELFLMRKRIDLAAGLILVATVILLASCQSGGGGNTTSKEDVTDPNISFSNLGTRHETP